MIKLAFVVPEENMVGLVTETFKEHTAYYEKAANDREEYCLDVCVALSPALISNSALEADILAARGTTAHMIKNFYSDLEIVEIPLSGDDIITAIRAAINQNGNLPIATFGSYNMVYSTRLIGEYLGVDIKPYLLESTDKNEVFESVQQAIADGRKLFIGGAISVGICHDNDLPAVMINMGKNALWQAISEAKRSACIRRNERKKTMQFQTIFDRSHEGIITTDMQKRITMFNMAAQNILGIDAGAAVGKRAEHLFPESRFSTILCGNADYANELVRYGERYLSVNNVHLHIGSNPIGNVVAFQDVQGIQRAEIKIRNKIHARGHVAKYHFGDIRGDSKSLQNVIRMAQVFSRVNSNVLIIGETGTGKELFAQSVHNKSDRQNGPFVAVNCAALSKSLLESELFGYVEGAFTGASKGGKPGLFELAHGGTIFLDEISEIPLDLQGRLLRVIQEREVTRLGHDRITPIDVRVISATNNPLLEQVRSRLFRSDLYYRLNVLTLTLPPLREREKDVIQLADYFLTGYAKQMDKPYASLSVGACKLLLEYDWNGNIRELNNVCEGLMVLNETGVISEGEVRMAMPNVDTYSAPSLSPSFLDETLREFEKECILKVLEQTGQDKSAAAHLLGMSRTTLWRRMKELCL